MNYAEEIGKILIERKLTIATTESCTGGLLSSKLTDVSGSSAYIMLNLVTYAKEAKEKMLGVVLDSDGAVSENCAFQMAKGLQNLTGADICISTTGIAGPTGGTKEKPVGTVCFGFSICGNVTTVCKHFGDLGRNTIRDASVAFALEHALSLLS